MAAAVKTLINNGWPPMMLTVCIAAFHASPTFHNWTLSHYRDCSGVRRDLGNGTSAEGAALSYHRQPTDRRLVDFLRRSGGARGSRLATTSRSGNRPVCISLPQRRHPKVRLSHRLVSISTQCSPAPIKVGEVPTPPNLCSSLLAGTAQYGCH